VPQAPMISLEAPVAPPAATRPIVTLPLAERSPPSPAAPRLEPLLPIPSEAPRRDWTPFIDDRHEHSHRTSPGPASPAKVGFTNERAPSGRTSGWPTWPGTEQALTDHWPSLPTLDLSFDPRLTVALIDEARRRALAQEQAGEP
jgi:hypothetical protein